MASNVPLMFSLSVDFSSAEMKGQSVFEALLQSDSFSIH